MWELMQPDLGKPLAGSWKGVRLYSTDREPATKRATLGSALRSQALGHCVLLSFFRGRFYFLFDSSSALWLLRSVLFSLHVCTFFTFYFFSVLCLITQSCPTFFNPMDCGPPRLLCPWDSPGKNTGVGCHFLLQGIFPTQGSNPGFPHCR